MAEDRACQQRARELYAQYEKDPTSVERNLVPALVSIVAHTGNGADYDKFYTRFKNAQTPQEETRYLFALGAFRQPDLIDRTLQMTLNGEVRTQNAPYLMRGILLNKAAREKAWSFMKEHWNEMLNVVPRQLHSPHVRRYHRPGHSRARGRRSKFFSEHRVKQGAKQMEQHLERLHIAVACKERWKDLLRG